MVRSVPRISEEIVRSTEAIIYTLKQIYDRKEKKVDYQKVIRNEVRDFLNDNNEEGDIEFTLICAALEALRLAIPSTYFELFDEVNDRIVTYYDVKDSPLVTNSMKERIRANIKKYFRKAFYYVFKVQQKKEEDRDEKYENAALGISIDAASIYNEGIGRDIRNKPKQALGGNVLEGTGEEDEEDDDYDDYI